MTALACLEESVSVTIPVRVHERSVGFKNRERKVGAHGGQIRDYARKRPDGLAAGLDQDPGILIGQPLMEILEVALGDKIVLTVAQANTGELSQEMFRIKGIFKTVEGERLAEVSGRPQIMEEAGQTFLMDILVLDLLEP